MPCVRMRRKVRQHDRRADFRILVGGTKRHNGSSARPCKSDLTKHSKTSEMRTPAKRMPLFRAIKSRINGLVDTVRRTAADIFNVPFSQRLEHDTFQLGQDPYWVTENIKATLISDPSRLIDPFLPKGSPDEAPACAHHQRTCMNS